MSKTEVRFRFLIVSVWRKQIGMPIKILLVSCHWKCIAVADEGTHSWEGLTSFSSTAIGCCSGLTNWRLGEQFHDVQPHSAKQNRITRMVKVWLNQVLPALLFTRCLDKVNPIGSNNSQTVLIVGNWICLSNLEDIVQIYDGLLKN